jgi:carbon monoxide dehydrogenase subunit G
MEMNGSERIRASKEAVWAALNDVDVLKQCIPGCESLEKTSETEMTAKVVLKIGPIKASFAGNVKLSDLDPPNGYRISGEGSGGVAGFAKGGATVQLVSESADITILNYAVDAQVGGKIAQLGARLIDGTAKKLAGEFFVRFATTIAPSVATEPETDKKTGWLGRFTGVAFILVLLTLGGTKWCCLTGIHDHTMSGIDGAPICRALAAFADTKS